MLIDKDQLVCAFASVHHLQNKNLQLSSLDYNCTPGKIGICDSITFGKGGTTWF